MVFTREDDRSIKLKIDESIETWFDGYAMIKDFEWINPYGSQPRGADLPQTFIQMIWSNACAVGCAIVKFQSEYSPLVHITCTYSEQPSKGLSAYEYGVMGSKCQTGWNPKYPGLCSENEFKINISESAPVTEWIKNEKKIGTNICSNRATNESVNWLIKIILPFILIATKLFKF